MEVFHCFLRELDISRELLTGSLPSFGKSMEPPETKTKLREREREAVSDVLILHLWTGYPSPTTGLCGRMNRRICFAVVFGGGDGDGGLVGRLFKLSLSWGPITWNQKSWEEWGQ